ncbi:MAG: hypothetical protein IJT00_10690 [Lachnospiraceae bacterium]|nr:hypothetical protein [Lachnospiraceae bacterium]
MHIPIWLIIVLVVMVAVLVVLYFLGKRAQKKQEEQQAQIDQYRQNVTMLVIDKKKVRLKDAGLPDMVMEKTPKLMRLSKVPVVKAKVGPQIMTFICDAAIFDQVPVKKEVKATVSGLYLTGVKGIHGNQVATAPAKKKNFFSRQIEKLQEKAGAKPV